MRLITCIGVDHDLALLPHFVDHYRALGLASEDMIAILNTRDPRSAQLADARQYCNRNGLETVEWIAPYTSEGMWAMRRAVQAERCAGARWVLSADIDEFHRYPEDLRVFLSRCDAMGVNVIQGVFVDRLHETGALARVVDRMEVCDQFPLSAAAMGVLGKAGPHHTRHSTVKVMALKPSIMLQRGGHDPLPDPHISWFYRASLGQFAAIDQPAYRFAVPTRVDHFHWTSALRASLEQRLATPGVSAAGREYGAQQLGYLEAIDGVDLKDVVLDTRPFPRAGWERRLAMMRAKGAAMTLAWNARRFVVGAQS